MEVESWFSFNSITDFTNNVRGIKEAYVGQRYVDNPSFDSDTKYSSSSVAAYVAKRDKAVNENVISAANDAIAKVKAMPAPFRDNLSWSTANRAAQTAVHKLQEALEAANDVVMK